MAQDLVRIVERQNLCAATDHDCGPSELVELLHKAILDDDPPRQRAGPVRIVAHEILRSMLSNPWIRLTRSTINGERSEMLFDADPDRVLSDPANWDTPGTADEWYVSFVITFPGEDVHAEPGCEHSKWCIGIWDRVDGAENP